MEAVKGPVSGVECSVAVAAEVTFAVWDFEEVVEDLVEAMARVEP